MPFFPVPHENAFNFWNLCRWKNAVSQFKEKWILESSGSRGPIWESQNTYGESKCSEAADDPQHSRVQQWKCFKLASSASPFVDDAPGKLFRKNELKCTAGWKKNLARNSWHFKHLATGIRKVSRICWTQVFNHVWPVISSRRCPINCERVQCRDIGTAYFLEHCAILLP